MNDADTPARIARTPRGSRRPERPITRNELVAEIERARRSTVDRSLFGAALISLAVARFVLMTLPWVERRSTVLNSWQLGGEQLPGAGAITMSTLLFAVGAGSSAIGVRSGRPLVLWIAAAVFAGRLIATGSATAVMNDSHISLELLDPVGNSILVSLIAAAVATEAAVSARAATTRSPSRVFGSSNRLS